MTKLYLGYFYKEHLNLYGDNGNVEVLVNRAKRRNIDVEVFEVSLGAVSPADLNKINLIFMGGGPDSGQKNIYKDLIENKKSFITDYVENEGTGLFICGAYQLLGRSYKAEDGTLIDGLGVFDLKTEHGGSSVPRCIGNVLCELSQKFSDVSNIKPSTVVGFENHGGRTYLGEGQEPFAKIIFGHGNNSKDKTEGIFYKNSIGSYLHGPMLSKNPHIADYLIRSAVGVDYLQPLDDSLVITAHNRSKELKQ